VTSLDIVTVNEKSASIEEIVSIVETAVNFFPKGSWEQIQLLGNVKMYHDVKIRFRTKVRGAFIFNKLVPRIQSIRSFLTYECLVLAVTPDPVISTMHRLEEGSIHRVVSIVRDYVSECVGFISLFQLTKDTASQVTAHGLGHSQGLKHHRSPIDLMYIRLLQGHPLQYDGFCTVCQRTLEKKRVNLAF
jgi:hypothetical protein